MKNRLLELREKCDLSLDELAERVGTSNQQISHLELGKRKLSSEWMERLAQALNVKPYELIYDPQEEVVPVVGYVGAGSEAHYYADSQNGGNYARMPVNGGDQSVAVEIRGTSLGPALDGWLAYYNDVRTPPTPDLLRKLCIVGLEDDRVLVKLLYPGSAPNLFNLHSNTSEPIIENVPIRWAALVMDIARK